MSLITCSYVYKFKELNDLGNEYEEKIAAILLVTLFSSKRQTDPKKQEQSPDILRNFYERNLVSQFCRRYGDCKH